MLDNLKKKINDEYLTTEVTKIKDGDLDLVVKNQDEIDRKMAGSARLKKFAELGNILFGMVKDYKNGNYKAAPWFTIAAIAVALLYVLNPLDFIPDFIPGLGYIDDFLLFVVALRFVETDVHSYLDWKIEEGKKS